MSRTGGGRGTNQYSIKGVGKVRAPDNGRRASLPEVQLRVDVHQTSYGATPIDPDHFEFLQPIPSTQGANISTP